MKIINDHLSKQLEGIKKNGKSERNRSSDDSAKVKNGEVPESGETKVSLSDETQTVNRLTSLAKDLPEVRMDRVNEIKGQIESGQYTVSSDKVAEKILKDII